MRVGQVYRDAERTKALDLRGKAVRPRDRKIRLQGENALEIQTAGVANAGQPGRVARPVGGVDHAHDPSARAGREQDLGRMWREAHDPSRSAGKPHRRTSAVDHGDARGAGSCHPQRERKGDRAPHQYW